MFFNKRNLWALLILILFLCIVSFLLGVYTLRNGTLRKAYDIFFALENFNQKSIDIPLDQVSKIDTFIFLNSKKKQNKLIKIRSEKYNDLKNIVTYGEQWKEERPWINTKFLLNQSKSLKGKFKLVGMNSDHFREANNWSVRVKLGGELYLYKYKKFNLLIPYSRGFFIDAFYNELFKKEGGLSIDTKPIITRLSDQYTLQLFEPFFSKEIIENQEYRDGMIISEDSMDTKGKPHLKIVHPNGYHYLSSDQRRMYQFYEKEFQKGQIRNYFNVKQYAFLAAVSINTGLTLHHFEGFNLNLYANPITGELLPFMREVEFIPNAIPSKIRYSVIRSNFYRKTNLNNIKYRYFNDFDSYLNDFVIKLNTLNIDSVFTANQSLKNLYYYVNQYYPWAYAFKKRIRIPIEYNRDAIKIIKPISKKSTFATSYENGVFHLKNVKIGNSSIKVKNATLIISGDVKREGDNRISIIGDSSSTIIFEQAKVNLFNIDFKGFGNHIKAPNRAVTSAITFYESNIKLHNVSFSDNTSGDDLVNVFRSTFDFNQVKISNSIYDGIDVDFSKGRLMNCIIQDAGNDGLDFGGSQALVYRTQLIRCGDKGISVGERSRINVLYSSIREAEIGFGLKDESFLRIKNISIQNNHLDIAAYSKKGVFEASTLDISPTDFMPFKYLIEPGVNLKQQLKVKTTNQAKNLLYGKKYGKASVR